MVSRPACADDADAKHAVAKTFTAQQQWAAEGWPLIQQYCLDCHNEDLNEGELDLSGFESLDDEGDSAGAMQRVLEIVRFGAMPPEDADVPSEAERKKLVTALDRSLYSVSCDLRPRPGKVTARRLNKVEYNHSIRDLFGMDLRPADAFPSDEVGAGFDNNADVLSLSPMLIEKYLAAAESVASEVVIDPSTLPRLDVHFPSDQLHVYGERQVGSFFGLFLKPSAVVWCNVDVEQEGEYEFTITCGSGIKKTDQKKGDDGKDESKDDDQQNDEITLGIYDDYGTLIGRETVGYFGGGGSGHRRSFRTKLSAGRHRFMIQQIDNDADFEIGKHHRADLDSLDPAWVKQAKQDLKEPLKKSGRFKESDYPLVIRRVSIEGPTKTPAHLLPPSQSSIVRKVARKRGDHWSGVDEAARECLKPLMRRAFRGPVTDEEIEPYVALVSDATDRGESYYTGLQIAISAVLVSPRFLFRIETPPAEVLATLEQDVAPEDLPPVELTPHQLATRLSFFLWSSMPDDELLKAADEGKLGEETLAKVVTRMLENPKSKSLSQQFASQWLGLRNLEAHEADAEQFSTYTESLKAAMMRETQSVFDHVLRSNLPVPELLTADYTFVNEELARHYDLPKKGLPKFEGDQFEKVSLAQTPRRGVLSHASVLTLTSNPNRTSPVQRGKWILENVLGTPPPEAPAGVPTLEDAETADAGASLREQMEIHRANPSCAACHRVMDQLGFGLEQFDAVGQFRTVENDLPIDASGELPGGRTFNGAAELVEVLGKTEAKSFAKTVTERLLTFALGRELTPTDRCTVDAIVEKTAKNGFRMADLIVQVATCEPFRYYDWQAPQPASSVDAPDVATIPPAQHPASEKR